MEETQKALFNELLTQPEASGQEHRAFLADMADAYPASNLLHALLARAFAGEAQAESRLNKAAIYSADRKALFAMLHQPDDLHRKTIPAHSPDTRTPTLQEPGIPTENSGTEVAEVGDGFSEHASEEHTESEVPDRVDERMQNIQESASGVEDDSAHNVRLAEAEPVPAEISEDLNAHPFPPEASAGTDKPDRKEFAMENPFPEKAETLIPEDQPEIAVQPGTPATSAIDEEVFEEISVHPAHTAEREPEPRTGIDEEIFEEISAGLPETFAPSTHPVNEPLTDQTPGAPAGAIDDEVFDEIAETPVTAFIPAEGPRTPATEPVSPLKIRDPEREFYEQLPENAAHEKKDSENSALETTAQKKPSRYHDEKMPYSFMWWLDKTRREHAQTYQPYAADTQTTRPPAAEPVREEQVPAPQNPLEQQYIEHIFHVRSVEELEEHTKTKTVSFTLDRRQDKIIEKFIREEPQISTPRPEKLDTENKARKSTEDHLEMVSETLARIYTEQMLYHKALDTYQKLRLKYPEKSAYFAARIRELEYKIR